MEIKNQNKTLLILDLDQTLIYATENQLERRHDFRVRPDYNVYKRPYLDEFLQQLKTDFLLGIWSSNTEEYTKAVVQHIIPEDITLEFVWSKRRCTFRRKYNLDIQQYQSKKYAKEFFFTKPIRKLRSLGYVPERILIIDDTPNTAQRNYGNAIYPSKYNGAPNDDELMHLATYLKLLKAKTNVRQIEKRGWRPFIDSSTTIC